MSSLEDFKAETGQYGKGYGRGMGGLCRSAYQSSVLESGGHDQAYT
jgi:hypothetical protein